MMEGRNGSHGRCGRVAGGVATTRPPAPETARVRDETLSRRNAFDTLRGYGGRPPPGPRRGEPGLTIETTVSPTPRASETASEPDKWTDPLRYREMFEGVDSGFCLIEVLFRGDAAVDYRILEANPAFERQSGLASPVGRLASELAPGLEPFWFVAYGRVARTGEPARFENGSDALGRWFDVQAFRVGEPDARQVAVMFRDTSERRRSELALQESREQLEQALSAGEGVGAWDWDVPTDRVKADARFAGLYGVEPGRAEQGAPVAEFFAAIHPGDLAHVQPAIEIALRTGGPFSAEYRLLQPGGGVRWVRAEGRCRLAPDGTPLRFPGVSFDITERRQAEARQGALLRLTDRLRDVTDPAAIAYEASRLLGETLEVSRVGYGVVDLQAETITIERDWNAPGVTTLAGVLHFRGYGSYIDDLKHGRTVAIADARRDPRTRAGAEALASITALSFVNMPLVEQGGFVALLYANHAAARTWSQAQLMLMREVAERVRVATERTRAEADSRRQAAELAHLNATLEAEVAKRTAELMVAEEQLRQSQKMEAVGQLTGGIAHDFNNLLTGIIGSLEMLSTRIAQGRLKDVDRYALAAQGAAKRAAALTHRLLAFSRRQTLDPRPVDANRLVAGMEELVRRTVGPSIHLDVVAAGGLWPILVDANQLENALLNLCINARDAMPEGGRVTIETGNRWLDARAARERDLTPGQYVSLCVSDTGAGMAPEVVGKAFDPFFTTKPLGQGTGLGLSMIYGFVRQSGGQVRIYSEPGQGAMICLYLPRHLGEAEQAETPAEMAEAPRAAAGETVLVVDDEPTVRMLVTEVLEELGYAALEAADGASGLKLLQSDVRVDLLVTDVGLPGGMNGRQMADAARLTRPGLKVLFITGYAENAVVGNGHLEPGMHVVTKPFAMEALAVRIRDLIGGG